MVERGGPVYRPERSSGVPLLLTLMLLAGIVLVFLAVFIAA